MNRRTVAMAFVFSTVLCAGASTAIALPITVSTDPADFILTPESFAIVPLGTNLDIVSDSGNITLDNANGFGNTGAHGYVDFSVLMSGAEYALNGDENFDVIFAAPQTAFAMSYADESVDSIFTVTFFNDNLNVGTISFVSTAPFGNEQFIGFISAVHFDQIEIREDDGVNNSNEFFQFYSATPASEPTSPALFALGLVGLLMGRRRRRSIGSMTMKKASFTAI